MYRMGTITNSDTMFCYFEMIKKLGAGSVLDVGMLLKRIGAVSRQMAGTEVDADIVLCGIDFFPEVYLPIYLDIYNEIISLNDFARIEDGSRSFLSAKNGRFDLAVMLEVVNLLHETNRLSLTKYMIQHADGILLDEQTGKWMMARRMIKGYYPIYIENSRFAWILVKECVIK